LAVEKATANNKEDEQRIPGNMSTMNTQHRYKQDRGEQHEYIA
jgi:hypothetical protein